MLGADRRRSDRELVVAGAFDQQTRAGDADLALVPKNPPERGLDGGVDLGVGKE
jgi:hypothetical protein